MAIKISGTTVVDDSRNFCNIATATTTCFVGDGSGLTGVSPVEVLQPENTSPADGATNVSPTPTLCGSQFVGLYCAHCCSCFQVSECSDFSTCNVFTCEIAGACREIDVPSGCLSTSTQHFFRLRYEDADGCCSEFSDATCFTTASIFYPTTLGESSFGGFYMGTICAAGSCYYLIMAPNATGCICCQWRTANSDSGVGDEQCDGYGNTYDHLANATHPAGNWIATRSIGGFTDWYLPAKCELNQLYQNCACAPAGEGFASAVYWSSTERTNYGAIFACRQDMYNGNLSYTSKTSTTTIRAVRRLAFP